MRFDATDRAIDRDVEKRAARLMDWHQRRLPLGLLTALVFIIGFCTWASLFRIDEVAQAHGEVIASRRVQVIQAVDGGVLASLMVREGDRVKAGQVLARLDQGRFRASAGETNARVSALQARIARLRAESVGDSAPRFGAALVRDHAGIVALELALFNQRRIGLEEDMRVLRVAFDLARKEQGLVDNLFRDGDASGTELLRAQRNANDAEARMIARQNKFLEDARADLSKAEDELAQGEQVLSKRLQEQADTVFVSQMAGIVKNIRMTTVGGVLKAGDELMQIVPLDDELVVETKVKPSDIARIRPGLSVSLRFDPFDYTVYGNVKGHVTYVSADTLKEDSRNGTETYYRVHVVPDAAPVRSSTGRTLEIQPGMTVQADIRTGERSVLAYLLKPLRKTLSESLGER